MQLASDFELLHHGDHMLPAVVEVGESSARVWPFGTRCWDCRASVGLASLGTDLMVLFFICDFF